MLNVIRHYFARRRIKEMFGRYISPEAVNRMVEAGEEPTVTGMETEITPFFASVNSYVSLAEQATLPQLRELLSNYFDSCIAEVQRENGLVDKILGDAIVAMFGAPVKTQVHALNACVAAMRCHDRVGELRERVRRESDKWPAIAQNFRIRIGLNTGVAIIGNLGPPTRFNYTMMGDNVNLAARMETAAKQYGVWTLCTETTKRACEHSDVQRILFRALGPVVVNGRAKMVELFEPAALRENASSQLQECIAVFESGLSRWRERAWDDAIRQFEKSAKLERDQPGTSPEIKRNPSLVYLEMARSAHEPSPE